MWPAIIAGGAAVISTALGVREARKNREFQERMSNTAHQREVRDMSLAGINPIMSARGGGASTPPGTVADYGELSKGVGTALAIKQAQANIDLTSSQAAYVRAQQADLQTQAASGRYAKISHEAELLDLDVRQRSALFDTVIEQARAQLDLTTSSARGLKARALLDEMDSARAMNARDLEEWLRGGTPGVRLFMEILRSVGAAGVGTALARKPVNITKFYRR